MGRRKLSCEEAQLIVDRILNKGVSVAQVARDFEVSRMVIFRILYGKTYSDCVNIPLTDGELKVFLDANRTRRKNG